MEVRLNKLISDCGICSRREADRLIEDGHVTVNGKTARTGQKIAEKDLVSIDGIELLPSKRLFNPDTARKQADNAREMPVNRKSAALRKTSRNNPVNRYRYRAAQRKMKGEEGNDPETHRTRNRRTAFGKK